MATIFSNETGFASIGTKTSRRLQGCFGLRQVRGVMVEDAVNVDLHEGELANMPGRIVDHVRKPA